jgi:hypothetical protein
MCFDRDSLSFVNDILAIENPLAKIKMTGRIQAEQELVFVFSAASSTPCDTVFIFGGG